MPVASATIYASILETVQRMQYYTRISLLLRGFQCRYVATVPNQHSFVSTLKLPSMYKRLFLLDAGLNDKLNSTKTL